jgi:nitrite reductase/ring-hydroxylating ferredoxin subunit
LAVYKKVAKYDGIRGASGKKIVVNGIAIALFKLNKQIFAIQNNCPHQGADLADGHVQGGKAVCPLHRWMFDLKTGAFSGNDNIRIPTYQTKVQGNDVYLLIDE